MIQIILNIEQTKKIKQITQQQKTKHQQGLITKIQITQHLLKLKLKKFQQEDIQEDIHLEESIKAKIKQTTRQQSHQTTTNLILQKAWLIWKIKTTQSGLKERLNSTPERNTHHQEQTPLIAIEQQEFHTDQTQHLDNKKIGINPYFFIIASKLILYEHRLHMIESIQSYCFC